MLKILKVVRFKTKSSVAQYFKAYLHLKIIFTWLKNGLKLVKLHFCHQIQFSFFIHNLDCDLGIKALSKILTVSFKSQKIIAFQIEYPSIDLPFI